MSDVSKWADEAMYTSEPMHDVNETGPQVYLLSVNADPFASIASATETYKGHIHRDYSTIPDSVKMDAFLQVSKTALRMPFETVRFHFLLEGVTRSFTHQLVRQRTAAYAQESMRFAVVEAEEDWNTRVALPPSIAGTADDHPQRQIWEQAVRHVQHSYEDLVNAGMPAEDARGLLPHNMTTRVNFYCDLRGLLDHAGNRLCTQAQFEWRQVFTGIVNAIRTTPLAPRWQMESLAGLFRPVCYTTGKCEFKANFDRKCKIRDRVDAFHDNGVPSEQWHNGWDTIPAIRPAEWLLDPSAAR